MRIALRCLAGKLPCTHTSSPPGFDAALQHWNERLSQPGYLFGREPNALLAYQSVRPLLHSRVLSVVRQGGP